MKTDQKEHVVLKPFVVAYSEEQPKKGQRAGKHLKKEEATKDVLDRLVERVKEI